MLYEVLFRELYSARIRYLIVGAVAINLHGVPRMTADLDLMVDLHESNLRRFIESLIGLGYRPRVPVQPFDLLDPLKRQEWKETKSMVVFTWIHPNRSYEEIDVFLENPIEFDSAYRNKKELPVEGFVLSLAGITDLINLKRMAGREQDRSDVEALKRLLRASEGGER
jgi:hypothetical protein